MARIVLTRTLPFPAIERLAAEHELETWPDRFPPSPERLRELLADAEGLLCMLTDSVDSETIEAAGRLKAIATLAVGTDNIDLDAASAHGIPVGNTPDVLTDATADLTFALLLASARRLKAAADDVLDGEWETWEPARWLGSDVSGATLGIVGLGRIGRAVARRSEGFGMTVLHTSRSAEGAVSLDELLERSDFVSLHCPLNPETRHLINQSTLARMRPTAHLVNTSRGPIVDQSALAQALREGEIAGAALDVTDPEPLAPGDPLLEAPNLLVVPHIGSATHRARERMADIAVDNLLAALDGRPMPHRANG